MYLNVFWRSMTFNVLLFDYLLSVSKIPETFTSSGAKWRILAVEVTMNVAQKWQSMLKHQPAKNRLRSLKMQALKRLVVKFISARFTKIWPTFHKLKLGLANRFITNAITFSGSLLQYEKKQQSNWALGIFKTFEWFCSVKYKRCWVIEYQMAFSSFYLLLSETCMAYFLKFFVVSWTCGWKIQSRSGTSLLDFCGEDFEGSWQPEITK